MSQTDHGLTHSSSLTGSSGTGSASSSRRASDASGNSSPDSSASWPGIVEEGYLTLAAGKPLFVAGELGGAAAFVADRLRGRERLDVMLPHDEKLCDVFADAYLRNGLTDEENALLFDTADLDLLVALILRGLMTLDRG